MRINYNLLTSTSDIPEWADLLIDHFLEAHHIDKNVDSAREFTWSPKGVQVIADWLKQQGYTVQYWEVDFVTTKAQMPVAYGFDIDDSCPKIVEHKLRYSGDDSRHGILA